MSLDLSRVLEEFVDDAASGDLAASLVSRVHRGVRVRRIARDAGVVVAAAAACGAIGSAVALAAGGRLATVSPGDPSAGPTPGTSWAPPTAAWPNDGPEWTQRMWGIDSVEPLPCGTRLGDFPTSPAVSMEAPLLVGDGQVERILAAHNEGYGTPDPGVVIDRESDRFTAADDAWAAAWRVDTSFLAFEDPGATVSLSGVDEGFAPWDAFDFVEANIALQLWSGVVIVDDDTIVVGRVHRANPSVGAGTVTLLDNRSYTGPERTYVDGWTLTSQESEAIDWCPAAPNEPPNYTSAAVVIATSNGGTTAYGWLLFPAP